MAEIWNWNFITGGFWGILERCLLGGAPSYKSRTTIAVCFVYLCIQNANSRPITIPCLLVRSKSNSPHSRDPRSRSRVQFAAWTTPRPWKPCGVDSLLCAFRILSCNVILNFLPFQPWPLISLYPSISVPRGWVEYRSTAVSQSVRGWVGWKCDSVTVTSSVSRRTRRKRRRTRRRKRRTRRCILTSQDEHQGEEDAAVRARRQPWHPDHTKGHQGKSTWKEKDKGIMGQHAELEVAEFWFYVVQVLKITIFAVLYLIVFAGDI